MFIGSIFHRIVFEIGFENFGKKFILLFILGEHFVSFPQIFVIWKIVKIIFMSNVIIKKRISLKLSKFIFLKSPSFVLAKFCFLMILLKINVQLVSVYLMWLKNASEVIILAYLMLLVNKWK